MYAQQCIICIAYPISYFNFNQGWVTDTWMKLPNYTVVIWQVKTGHAQKCCLTKNLTFRFHNVFWGVTRHHNFFSDPGESRMEHKRLPKERAQLGEALPGFRIWSAKLGLSGLQNYHSFHMYNLSDQQSLNFFLSREVQWWRAITSG